MIRRALAPLVLALLASALWADEVVLKNGQRISCQVEEVNEREVRIRLPHGRMTLARDRVESIVREVSGEYLKREGSSSLRRGSTAAAVELFEKAVAADPKDEAAISGLLEALFRHAEALRAEHRFEDARGVLERRLKLDPGDPASEKLFTAIARDEAARRRILTEALSLLEKKAWGAGLIRLNEWRLARPADDEEASDLMGRAHLAAGIAASRAGALRASLDHFRAAAIYGQNDDVDEALYLLQPVAAIEALGEGDLEAARHAIDRVFTTYPDQAVPVFLRAALAHMKGDVKEAVDGYAEAARMAERRGKPPRGLSYGTVRGLALNTLSMSVTRPTSQGASKWRETFLEGLYHHESKHFHVYAPTRSQAEAAAKAADAAYSKSAGDLMGGVPAASRAELVVHPTRQTYIDADPRPAGTPLQGLMVRRAQTAGLCYDTLDVKGEPLVRVEVFAGQSGLLVDTIPHEVVHVVQRRGVVGFRTGHWLDEGLATTYESEDSRERRREALSRVRSIIPLREFVGLESTPPNAGLLFYNEAHALTEYLRDLGSEDHWQSFLKSYAAKDFETAIHGAYGLNSIDRLERDWHKALGR